MNDLAFYYKEGWQHIISLGALDHQLFIVALAAIYTLKDWRKVLILVTAFTVGHSITLALSVYDILRANDRWVEFLIPCTIVITAGYTLKNWKIILVLIASIFIGYYVILRLSIYDVIRLNATWLEFLIPFTLAIAVGFGFIQKNISQQKLTLNYAFALFFGLIHGLGFANTIRFMLAKDQTMGLSLFGFNIGLELGQILIVSIVLLLSYLIINVIKIKQAYWIYLLSSITFIWAVKFALERLP